MKTPLRIAAAFLLAATLIVPAAAQEKIKFTKKSLVKGAVVTVVRTTSEDMTQSQTVAGQDHSMVSTSRSKYVRVWTVLETSDKGVTKAKVEFKTFESEGKMTSGGQDRDTSEESPLTGKTYILTAAKSGLEATTVEKEAVSAPEMEALNKKLKSRLAVGVLVDPHRKMDLAIGAREMTIGQKITVDREIANKVFGAGNGDKKIKAIHLTLTGKKSVFGVDCGVFDIKLELDFDKAKEQGLEITADLKGELLVGINSLWAYKANVAGPIRGEGTVASQMGDMVFSLNGKTAMSAMAAIVTPKPAKK